MSRRERSPMVKDRSTERRARTHTNASNRSAKQTASNRSAKQTASNGSAPKSTARRPAAKRSARSTSTASTGRRTRAGTPPRGTTRRKRSRAERSAEVRRRRVAAPAPVVRAKDQRSGSPRVRLIIALIVMALALGVVVARLAMLQTTNADQFRSAGVEQWTRTVELPAQRGTIFDRNGHELAMSIPAADISINPKLIQNGPAVVQLLDDLLDLDDEIVADLLAEVAAADRGFVYVARQADADLGEQIADLRLAGVNVDETTRREMPGGYTARTVIGRTDIDGIGISGLELQYDDVLTGSGGELTREIAPGGRTIPGSEVVSAEPVPGDDLVLSIDRSMQFATEQVMLDQVAAINARGGLAVVLDTKTGEILANASVRRDSESGEPVITTGNFVAVDSYEPGSVAKVITVAGALDQGVVTPDTWFEVPWRKQYYDDLLSDSHQHPTEPMSVTDILVESSNIGTITIQEQMNRFVHHDYMTAFGLGSVTALDFPGESPGIFKDADELWGSERVTVSYGQGLSSTPIQMVAAVNVIANDGVYVEPKLVLGTVGPDGNTTDAEASGTRRVVSEQAARQTAEMMRLVVCDGTATRAQVDGISVAGKTGTAFKAHENGTYFDERGNRVYYSSFVGFFPVEDPELTVLIAVDEPPAGTGDRFGGTAAAPAFAELVPTLIHERGITPPDDTIGCGVG